MTPPGKPYRVSVVFKILPAAACALLLAACDRADDELCASTGVIGNLRSEFSYELQQEKDLPQVAFGDLRFYNSMNSIVWCRATATLSGEGDRIVRALNKKFGSKKWSFTAKRLKKSRLRNWTRKKIRDSRSALALYFLNRYSRFLRDRRYELSTDLTYNIDLTRGILRNADYREDLNVKFLGVAAEAFAGADAADRRVILAILNSESAKQHFGAREHQQSAVNKLKRPR